MKMGKALKHKRINLRSIRIALTTDDLATLLGVSSDVVRGRISRGELQLVGNAVQDFKMLESIRRIEWVRGL